MVLSDFNRRDIEVFNPTRVAVVNNGIRDPWEGKKGSLFEARFSREQDIGALFQRSSRAGELPGGRHVQEVKLVYLGHLTRSKGLVDALEAVRMVNADLKSLGIPLTVRLFVGGDFASESDRVEIGPILRDAEENQYASQLGFVSGMEKLKLLQESDAMLFPTMYENENQPVVILEALSVGLPVITTRWRSIPELLPAGYPWLAPPGAPDKLAAIIMKFLAEPKRLRLREHFLQGFTLEKHLNTCPKRCLPWNIRPLNQIRVENHFRSR